MYYTHTCKRFVDLQTEEHLVATVIDFTVTYFVNEK